jgi:PadR family transcriptional regulator, regulatory protein PadR
MSRVIAIREQTRFVLASLAGGPMRGPAIIKRVEALSGGRIRLATGTLFTVLDRLTAAGYVRSASEEWAGGRQLRGYVLTLSGLRALQAVASRAAGFVTRSGHAERVGSIVNVGGRVRIGGKG